MNEKLSIVIGLLLVVAIIAGLLKNLKEHRKVGKLCEECGGKFKLTHLKDPLGVNLKPKVTISIFRIPRKYTETWACQNCGKQKEIKMWDD